MYMILDDLQHNLVQKSTKANYHFVWQNFNKFVIHLDRIPRKWEEKVSLYCAFLSKNRVKSSTIKSYISAIKYKLVTDGYNWQNKLVAFTTLTKACKLKDDSVYIRLPINKNFLEVIIFETERYLKGKRNEYKNSYLRPCS